MKKRIVARLDIKNEHVIKGIHLEGLRKVGEPNAMALKYYRQGVDEILLIDAVAAYYDRNSLSHIISQAVQDIFVPITVGGGIRSIEDIRQALQAGADKVAINTRAIQQIDFLREAVQVFGSQSIIGSVQAKKTGPKQWQAYYDNGREASEFSVRRLVERYQQAGAGELLVTSIDCDGTRKGYDLALLDELQSVVEVPMIYCGGAGTNEDVAKVLAHDVVDAAAVGSMLHYRNSDVGALKQTLASHSIPVRL